MYKKVEQFETESENFELPFGGKLAEDNRWVIMAKLIPWSEVSVKRKLKRKEGK